MGISYCKLSEEQLDVFISMRIKQLREEGAMEDIDNIHKKLAKDAEQKKDDEGQS